MVAGGKWKQIFEVTSSVTSFGVTCVTRSVVNAASGGGIVIPDLMSQIRSFHG